MRLLKILCGIVHNNSITMNITIIDNGNEDSAGRFSNDSTVPQTKSPYEDNGQDAHNNSQSLNTVLTLLFLLGTTI
jgi:hypothetical protein